MLTFAAVQYNDPDGLVWGAVYTVPALLCATVALRPRLMTNRLFGGLLGVSVASALAGAVYFWPRIPGFWRREIWWTSETVRESMGLMIVVLVLGVAAVTALWERHNDRRVRGHGHRR